MGAGCRGCEAEGAYGAAHPGVKSAGGRLEYIVPGSFFTGGLIMKVIRRFIISFLIMLAVSAGTVSAAAVPYRYYGRRLTGFDRKAYVKMVNTFANGAESVDVPFTGTVTYRTHIADIILDDNPRLYWIGGMYISHFTASSYGFLKYTPMLAFKTALRNKALFNRKVAAAVKTVKKKCAGKKTAQKVKVIHNYIVQHCVYKSSAYDQSAYGVFVRKKAVCAGYARAFKLLCDEMKIRCICVSGKVGTEDHMVNFVKIGKKWYYVDCTWDDPGSGSAVSYKYFLLGSSSSRCRASSNNGIALPTLSVADYR